MTTTEDTKKRTGELADLTFKLITEMDDLNNGEAIDVIAVLLAFYMNRAMRACGPDTAPKVLERFASRLTEMHPRLRVAVVRR